MNGAFFASGALRPFGMHLKRWLGLWMLAEAAAFLLAVKLVGVGATLLLMFLTSVLGVTILRRIGLGAAQRLQQQMMSGGTANEVFVDGTLTALGAVLLVAPGFVSDLVGLALVTPSVRQQLASRFLTTAPSPTAPVGRRASPDVIDLGPDDWRVVERSPGPPPPRS